MKTSFRFSLALAILLGPFTIGVATSPKTPWHQYVVHGTIERASGLPKENFSCTIAGKVGRGEYTRVRALPNYSRSPIAITDTSGSFLISIADRIRYDSLAIMFFLPDRPPVYGQPFAVSSASVLREYTSYNDPDVTSCAGCKSGKNTIIVDGYVYNFPEQRVVIPF